VLRAEGSRLAEASEALYSESENGQAKPISLTFIPYYKWANRGESEMKVWIRK
jgi:DUF1680 family protein